jgi:acyl-coenzyme A synthetase/AMP-(fatty) acid ligase
VRAALRALGVAKGDRVAAYLPNIPEALVGLLAAAAWAPSGRRAHRISARAA